MLIFVDLSLMPLISNQKIMHIENMDMIINMEAKKSAVINVLDIK